MSEDIKLNVFMPSRVSRRIEPLFDKYNLLAYLVGEWWLPTEVVIDSPQVVSPQVARVWNTEIGRASCRERV